MEAKIHSKDINQMLMGTSLQWQQSDIYSVDPDATIIEASRIMKEQQIGDVLVLDRSGKGGVLGILTDRDIALSLANGSGTESKVEDIMSKSVITASVNDDIFSIIRLMKENGITRIPLLTDQNKVVGVVSARNLIEVITSALFDLTEIAERQQDKERETH